MTKPFRGLLFAALAVGMIAVFSIRTAVAATCRRCVTVVREVFIAAVPAMPRAGEVVATQAPVVQIVRAVAYRVRRLKRDVMDVRPGYRHCPSV